MTEELHWLAIDASAMQYIMFCITLLAVLVNVISKSTALSIAVVLLSVGTIIASATTTPNTWLMGSCSILMIAGTIGAIKYLKY